MAKRDYKEIIVIDFEATCYDQNNWPEGEKQDIIEIGVCRFNVRTLQVYDKMGILVKPERSSISDYCTELTGITPEDAESAASFQEGVDYLREYYASHMKSWASYGSWDYHMLRSQCADMGIEFPFLDRHINIKLLFPLVFNLNKEYGLKKALSKMKMEFEGRHHSGADDAWNAAKVLKECFIGGKIK